jgi:hypothetical protein
MTAETGESLRARFDVAVFDTIWQPVSVAGRGLPDIMRGGREADRLDGGGGADTLEASWMGAATLRLGKDKDADVVLFHLSRFKPYAAVAPDIVAGFDPRHDRIHVVDMALAPIDLRFGTDTTLGSEVAAVIYDGVTGRLFMGVSLFGAAHVATIIGAPDLTAEHFVIA